MDAAQQRVEPVFALLAADAEPSREAIATCAEALIDIRLLSSQQAQSIVQAIQEELRNV